MLFFLPALRADRGTAEEHQWDSHGKHRQDWEWLCDMGTPFLSHSENWRVSSHRSGQIRQVQQELLLGIRGDRQNHPGMGQQSPSWRT